MIIAQMLAVAQFLEGTMLVCFGVSWPIAILKTLRAKRVEGKSFIFLVLVFLGYCAGIVSKFIRAHNQGASPEWVTALYALNAILVAIDAALYLKYSRPRETSPAAAART